MSACINAMRVLTDPAETGAVTLCLPQDVQGEAGLPESFFARRVHRLDRRPASAAQLADAVAAIKASRKPLIVCGGGEILRRGRSAVPFAERYGCPSPKPRPGRDGGLVSPLNVGGVGETAAWRRTCWRKRPTVIGVGTRFSDFTTASKWIFQHPEVRFLNINVSNFDARKLDGIAMLADAREAMTALDAALADSGWQAGWGAQIESVQSRQLKDPARLPAVWQEKSFVPEIDDHLDRESVYREFRQITDST